MLEAVYFFALSFYPQKPKNTLLFLLMALSAAAQLLAEMSRGLFNYLYPLHDVRLLVIVILAMCFGTCLMFFAVQKSIVLTNGVIVSGKIFRLIKYD